MFFRGIPVRRSIKAKLILISLILLTFIFYMKFVTSNTDASARHESNIHYHGNDKLFAGDYSDYNESTTINLIYLRRPSNEMHLSLKAQTNSEYERQILADTAKQVHGLGDNGKAASLIDNVSKEIGQHQLKKIAINEELSEHISFNRTLQDARNPLCQSQHFSLNELPTTSVVIIFYNEPYSVLVRTVHSVINTVDHRILKEIILVDDCSTNIVLREKLDYYIQKKLPTNVVKVIRLKQRLVFINNMLEMLITIQCQEILMRPNLWK